MDHDLLGIISNPSLVELGIPQIKFYAKQLLCGLSYLHDKEIIHRDLKCENILVSNRGELKIADLGSSRRTIDKNSCAKYTLKVVTRYYRAPELFAGAETYTCTIDVWSAGVIVAEMVHRDFLFPGESDLHTLQLIFELVGTPNQNLWKSKFTPDKKLDNTFRHKFPNQTRDFYDFLYRMLYLNPAQRSSASEALNHVWFIKEPMMCHYRDCPKYHKQHLFGRNRLTPPN